MWVVMVACTTSRVVGVRGVSRAVGPRALMAEPCLWRWEIHDPSQGQIVANSWSNEWMAYDSPDEAYRAGHLPGAISVPITELDRRFKEIPRAPRVVLYCGCPREDIATAFVFLSSQGYVNHAVLEDGFDGWLKRRYPLAR